MTKTFYSLDSHHQFFQVAYELWNPEKNMKNTSSVLYFLQLFLHFVNLLLRILNISFFFFFFLIYRLMFAIIWNILLSLCNVKMAKHRQCFLIQNRHRVKNPVSPLNLNTGLTKDGKALIWTLPYTTIFTFFKYVHLEKLWCMPFRSPDIGTLVSISVVNIQENYCLKA